MAETSEPQTEGAPASSETKDVKAEESMTVTTEAPESEATTNTTAENKVPDSEHKSKDSEAVEETKDNGEKEGDGKEDGANTSTTQDKTQSGEKAPESKNQTSAAAGAEASSTGAHPLAIVSSSKKSRPPYKYDPDKITLRFLFANRDGLTVTVECNPSDTVGEVKGALLSVWPEDLPDCSGGDRLRLICMGKGILMPDTRTLKDFEVPVFKTHPTPINVSVRPENTGVETSKGADKSGRGNTSSGVPGTGSNDQTSQGCACVIL